MSEGRSAPDGQTPPRLHIPLPGRRGSVYITAPFPVTPDDWAYLMNVLETMKPALISEGESDA